MIISCEMTYLEHHESSNIDAVKWNLLYVVSIHDEEEN